MGLFFWDKGRNSSQICDCKCCSWRNSNCFLERLFDTKVFLSGPHNRNSSQPKINFNSRHEFEGYNPVFIKKLISSTNDILNNLLYT